MSKPTQSESQTKWEHALANRRREIAAEVAALNARVRGMASDIRDLAENGSPAQRKLARRWLALLDRNGGAK